jgi:hypothetical protein
MDNNNQFYVCEEYGSSVWAVSDTSLKLQQRYSPFGNAAFQTGIDTIIKRRIANRGFEGVAFTPNGKMYSILQSPLSNPNSSASYNSRLHRILELDPNTGTTRMLAYEHDEPIGGSTGIRNRDWKIGDLVAINNNEFLVLEHAERGGYNKKSVYKIDISAATPIVSELYGTKTFEQLENKDSAAAYGVIAVQKTLYLDLLAAGWNQIHDKPEGLSIVNDTTIAVVNDNDYGISAPGLRGKIEMTGSTTCLYIFQTPSNIQAPLNQCFPIQITTSGSNNACSGSSVTLLGNGMNGGSFSWLNSGNSISGATSNNYSANTSGNYQMVETTAFPYCMAISNSITVNIWAPPAAPVVTISNDSLISSSGYINYQWYLNGSQISGANDSVYQFTQNGNYYVEVSDSNGCTSQSPVITINSVNINAFSLEQYASTYPNPLTDETNFNLLSPENGLLKMVVYDGSGKVVFETEKNINANEYFQQKIPLLSVGKTKGLYYLLYTLNGKSGGLKLILN